MIKTVRIYCLNNKTYKEYPIGTTLMEIQHDLFPNKNKKYLAALVNNKNRSLSFPVYFPKRIRFIDSSSATGHRVYTKSLAFVLYKAVADLYPKAKLRIEHAIGTGYFCYVKNEDLSNADMAAPLHQRMQEIIAADIPFDYHYEDTNEVIETFEAQGFSDKVDLIKHKGELYTSYYSLEDTKDSFYSSLVPSTSYLTQFDLQAYHKGLLLKFPSKGGQKQEECVADQPKLMDVFQEFASWNRTLKVSNISDINKICGTNQVSDLVMLAEALQEKKVLKITEMITQQQGIKIILISGPSSSGKTTFSKRLALQLKLAGLKPLNLSLDDYYVDRELSPLDINGEYDFEHLEALDLPLLNEQLQHLLDGKEVLLPKYLFKEGKSTRDNTPTRLHSNEVLVVEGIHALNPKLTALINDNVKFKVYVSALTTISLDNHNHIPTSDNRLIRRIVRDYNYRGTSAEDSIKRWDSVRRGEDRWIYPYQEEADVMFNSSLLFELPVLKQFIEPILKEVKRNCDAYVEADRLLNFLSFFETIDGKKIPPTSLLREFLGGSSFNY